MKRIPLIGVACCLLVFCATGWSYGYIVNYYGDTPLVESITDLTITLYDSPSFVQTDHTFDVTFVNYTAAEWYSVHGFDFASSLNAEMARDALASAMYGQDWVRYSFSGAAAPQGDVEDVDNDNFREIWIPWSYSDGADTATMAGIEERSNLNWVPRSPMSDIAATNVRLPIAVFTEASPVPIPGAVWLLASGLIGIVGIRRARRPRS